MDVDRDGWLDLLIGHYVEWEPGTEDGLDCTYGTPRKDYCAVKYFTGLGLQLYRNLGDGRFVDATQQAGFVAPGARVLGMAIVDYNQDGWPDVLVANDLTPSLFFANQGNGTFREIGVQSGLVIDEGGVAFAGMGIDAAYINNDDQLCVAIGNFTGQPTTLHCQVRTGTTYHPEVFTEQSHRAGLARPTLRMVTFGLFFFDADLDGWQDLFMVNGHVVNEEHLRNVPYAQPPQLFHNRGDGTFREVVPPAPSGLAFSLIGRGAAYADYDHDGDLDLLLTANQGPAYLLRNDTPRTGAFLRSRDTGHAQQSRWHRGTALAVYHGPAATPGHGAHRWKLPVAKRTAPARLGYNPGKALIASKSPGPQAHMTCFVAYTSIAPSWRTRATAPHQGSMAQQPATPRVTRRISCQRKRAAIAQYQTGRFEAARQHV